MDLKSRYEKVRRHAGLVDVSDRGKLDVRGDDRLTFLQSMVSNDVLKLDERSGCYSTFLTPRGRMIADFFIYRLTEAVLLDMEGSLAEKTAAELDRFIVMDEVEILNVSDVWGHLRLFGPESQRLLSQKLKMELPLEDLRMAPVQMGEHVGWVIRSNELDATGYELLSPKSLVEELKAELLAEGSIYEVEPDLLQVLRIEAGRPLFGVDMGEDNYPVEARLKNAISYTKGCYVGQEVVSKATYVGGVSRYLCRLQIQGDLVPESSDVIFNEEGNAVGAVTSAAWSPSLGQVIALGYVKKNWAEPRTLLTLQLGGDLVSALVVSEFEGRESF